MKSCSSYIATPKEAFGESGKCGEAEEEGGIEWRENGLARISPKHEREVEKGGGYKR